MGLNPPTWFSKSVSGLLRRVISFIGFSISGDQPCLSAFLRSVCPALSFLWGSNIIRTLVGTTIIKIVQPMIYGGHTMPLASKKDIKEHG